MATVVRSAALDDLDAVVGLTRQRRQLLAAWEPTFWNPRRGSDDLHPLFLRYCIDEPSIDVRVAVEDERVVGCVFAHPQHEQWFLDDLCVDDERWHDMGGPLVAAVPASPLVVCCPRRDTCEAEWLRASGAQRVAEYHVLELRGRRRPPARPAGVHDGDRARFRHPAHTFCGGRLNATTPEALRLTTPAATLVGSAPLSPPIYDPGGPTTVVESISGPDLAAAVEAAVAACLARGDAQLLVVTDTEDRDLRQLMRSAGSTVPVDVWTINAQPGSHPGKR